MTVGTDATGAEAPWRVPKPRALIFSVYGAFARDVGDWLAVADLIELMGTVDIDEQAVRSSISRLKRRGLLVAERRDGVAGYRLSAEATEIIAAGDHRILEPAEPARLADGWVIAVFSVPETERTQRHVLRSQLTWLGFGSAASGVWVAPAHLLDDTKALLARLGLDRYVTIFSGEHVLHDGASDPRAAVASWWDLESLRSAYAEFLTEHRPALERWSGGAGHTDAQAFADYLRALTQWRRLPYLDPGLPVETLPADWNGQAAADLFFGLRGLLGERALRHVRALVTRG